MAAAAEVNFEYLALALEALATRGTVVTPPTEYLAAEGSLTPRRTKARGIPPSGVLAENGRSKTVRKWGEWAASLSLDAYTLPVWLAMAVKNVTTPTTPATAILSRLWTYNPSLRADDLRSATLYGGDPAVQIWQAAYAMVDELTISSDAGSEDVAGLELSGFSRFPAKVSPPTLPAQALGDLIVPGDLQVWIDTSSAIGTTEITGRVVSAEHKLTNNLSRKHLAQGPTNTKNFVRHGRGRRHMETKIVFELLDTAQYDQWDNDDFLKLRVRHNGPLIESISGTDFYNYVQVDTYGTWDAMDWGTFEDTNRTIELTVLSEYDGPAVTAGWDWAMAVQCKRATL